MKNLSVLVFTLVSLVLLGSCRKEVEEPVQTTVTNSKDLKVSDFFGWSTTKGIQVTVNVESASASGLLSKVLIYKADPSTGAKSIANGSAGYGFPFLTDIIVPSFTEGLWIEVKAPDGNHQIAYQTIVGTAVTYTLQAVKSGSLKATASGPDCTTGCFQEISGSGTVTIRDGKTYCVTTSFTGTIDFQHWNGGGTLRVCGSASPQNINNMGNNCHVVVADGGTFSIQNIVIDGTGSITAWHSSAVTINSLNMNQQTTSLTNYSSNFAINGTFSPNGTVTNYGTITIAGDYNGNSPNGQLINSGSITTTGSLNMNNNLNNSGTITIGDNFQLNTNHTFINSCMILVQNNASLNAGVFTMNSGYLQVGNTYQINASGQFVMQNQSMVSSNHMSLNNSITGAGSMNTIKTTGNATINASRTVSGAIEWADNDGVLTNGTPSLFINGALFTTIANATNYIPVSACNPTGIGTPVVTDSDGDGVADVNDDYPLDGTRAYNNFYPSENGWSSMAFEDLWPAFGDYDMNDLVVNIRFNRVTNAQNKVVDLVNAYEVKAMGGGLKSGFGLQLDDVDVGAVESVTGYVVNAGSYISLGSNGLETGTSKPVAILWDNTENVIHRAGGSFFNTEQNGFVGTSDLVTLTVHFSTPQTSATVGLPPYNHFLIKNLDRDVEIHQPGKIPTSKANTALFGTGNDDTNPSAGKYYKSENNLPWSIFIAEEFDYPIERADIVNTHLKFAEWAQSNGAQYTDWYLDNPGYRNNANIFVP